ncbi:MAG: CdvA-like protein [Crenarchaeota archaeon]|nr:CdvA-like protein [Thermoproteota archaeon]
MDNSRILGLPVKDVYDREIGTLVGFEIDPRGMPSKFFIMMPNGGFIKVDGEAVEAGKDYVLLKNFWKIKAESLIRGVEITRRRLEALENLRQEHQIPTNIYDELKGTYLKDMNELSNKVVELSSELSKIQEELKNRLDTLMRVRSINKVQLSTGEVDEVSYKAAETMLETNLDITLLEIKETESIMARLKNLRQKMSQEVVTQQRVSNFIELLRAINSGNRQRDTDSPLVVRLQSVMQNQQ